MRTKPLECGRIRGERKQSIGMAGRKRKDGETRHGRHADNMFRVALYLTAEEKAIAVLAAEMSGVTLSDVLRRGIQSEALRLGIITDSGIAEKFRNRVDAYRHVLVAIREESKERGK